MKYMVRVDGREIEVEVNGDQVMVGGRTHRATLESIPGTPLRQLLVDGRPTTLSMAPLGRGRWAVTEAGERLDLEVLDERAHHIQSLTLATGRRHGAGALKAPMPGLVVRVQVQPGERVSAGSGLVVLEAMKMENELKATSASVVKAVRIEAGEAVEKGQVLVEFEDTPPP